MKLTPALFEAYLKCPIKCYLRSTGQTGAGNAYAEWVREQNDAYRKEGAQRLVAAAGEGVAAATPGAEDLKTATWGLAVDVPLETETMATRLHAVERVPSEGRGRPAQFIPIRFVFFNKLSKDDRLLVAFDGLVLSEVLGREVGLGRIIHGDDNATLKVKVGSLLEAVRKSTAKMSEMLAAGSPPDLFLNRHCGECEFRDGCRQKAVEKDDLSLLAGMSAKERKRYHNKGIFTVTQLSYTFRPRRRPKRLREKREKYHHALKALAIREKKIHIVGNPELKIDGTPVYLDVEGLPDGVFYYLIGARVGDGEPAVQHSLWADTLGDEVKIWRQFLGILEKVERPILIHYGSYETLFFKRMNERHGGPPEASVVAKAINTAVNLLSVIFAQVYFPTLSNGLKDIAKWIGFKWADRNASGLETITWRRGWEQVKEPALRSKLVSYNTDDCVALALICRLVMEAGGTGCDAPLQRGPISVVNVDGLEPHKTLWTKFSSPISDFEAVNKAARWDYQRSRVYVRTSKRLNRAKRMVTTERRQPQRSRKSLVAATTPEGLTCPRCGQKPVGKSLTRAKPLYDIQFGKSGLRARNVQYTYSAHWCPNCSSSFGQPQEFWRKSKYGRNFMALVVYLLVSVYVSQSAVQKMLSRLFGYDLNIVTINHLKSWAADYYAETRNCILATILKGKLVHVDETKAVVKGKAAYVWVFTSLYEVAYFYSDSREGEFVRAKLSEFRGVLVSDFYGAYDSLACPKQKCLLHLMRDLNRELLNNPFDEELKTMLSEFAALLRAIVETVDRWGLKRRFLQKHAKAVARFYKHVRGKVFKNEAANTLRTRFEKNRESLFTFLDHDGVPWNNNNAEHAIKAFAALRAMLGGTSTPSATEDFLVLLSVCQTCEYMGVDFLDFLRSGEKDIYAFAAKHPCLPRKRFVPPERKRYDETFKRRAVEHWQSSGRPASAVAAELGINPWNLDDWRKRLCRSAVSGQISCSVEQSRTNEAKASTTNERGRR